MRYLVFIIFLIPLFSCGNKITENPAGNNPSSGYNFKGSIRGYHNAPFYIYGFYGFQSYPVDSGFTSAEGEFESKFSPGLPPGLYRFVIQSNITANREPGEKYIDFIFNRENISFTTSYNYLTDSLTILSSKENKGFYEYMKKRELHHQKMNALGQFLLFYPEKDNFHRKISRQVKRKRNQFSNFSENLIKKNEKLLFSRIIQIQQTPRIEDNLPENRVNSYVKNNFFCTTNFGDTLLLRTPYLPEKVLNYISLYRNARLTEEEQEEEYIRAVDSVMIKASVNEEVFYILAEYLVNGFESLHMHPVSEYITMQYILGGPCDREDIPENLLAKATEIQKLAIGMEAPDFLFHTTDGKQNSLHELPQEYTLLIFWTTTCPHCTDMLPKLNSIANDFRNKKAGFFEIVAISVENDEAPWKEFIREEKLNFIHSSELKGWEAESVKLYNINATPMLFLLDKDKKIVLKPNRLRPLERFLQRQFL